LAAVAAGQAERAVGQAGDRKVPRPDGRTRSGHAQCVSIIFRPEWLISSNFSPQRKSGQLGHASGSNPCLRCGLVLRQSCGRLCRFGQSNPIANPS
jgi:hypothetical protein